MDERFLALYDRELGHVRKMAGEFAKAYPKIAGRLSLDEFQCADPFVERLLEGFAFLTARAQMKLEAEFPRFTQSLLETLYPHYLAPTPSMVMVQFEPDPAESDLATGTIGLPRDTLLRGLKSRHDRTRCTYRTAHDVTLWPVTVVEAQYGTTRELASWGVGGEPGARAAIRLRLKTTAGLAFSDIRLDSLPLYLRGTGRLEMRLYEHVLAHAMGLRVQPTQRPLKWHVECGSVRRYGFDDAQRLLPFDARSFQGYRLLHEYFSFPQRFMFVELAGLREGLQRCPAGEVDVLILLSRVESELENVLSASNFLMHCTPAVNVFPKRTDRIAISDRQSEFHVVPDRTRPEDFEVYQVLEVVGHATGSEVERTFRPFYRASDLDGEDRGGEAYFAVHREPRQMSASDRLYGTRTSGYTGGEVFLSLVDAEAGPYHPDLAQLSVATLCTNRDLPLRMPFGQGGNDFDLDTHAPVKAIRCLHKTDPRPSHAHGEAAWRTISHLTLNYLSLVDDAEQGATALRSLLSLYGQAAEPSIRHQIEGIRSIRTDRKIGRVVRDGRIAFVRGLQITVTMDEAAFEGTGVFLLGAVLERFFAKYVSINAFTETVVRTDARGEIMRWPANPGQRHTI
ncbi:MAG: type VI secretion system baseplate subunit TssF [Planctomycetes bacterium]|nr:type VI secretion system baseplate subunit TssF [Planctomycetota bacterium]